MNNRQVSPGRVYRDAVDNSRYQWQAARGEIEGGNGAMTQGD